MRYWS